MMKYLRQSCEFRLTCGDRVAAHLQQFFLRTARIVYQLRESLSIHMVSVL